MREQDLVKLLERYYPKFPPRKFPGADQHEYATRVRDAINRARQSGANPVYVLDFGCGRGAVELYDYRDDGVKVCGADIDTDAAQNRFIDEFRLCVDKIDYSDNTFDVVCSAHVFEHISKPEHTLAENRRVMKPKAKLIALTPNARSLPATVARLTPTSFHVWLNAKRGRAEEDTFATFYRLNDKRAVMGAAANAGLTVETIDYWEWRPEYFFCLNRCST